MTTRHTFEATDDDAGSRLDSRLARWLDRPRNQIRKWVLDGVVQVNGRGAKPSATLSAGDVVHCTPPERTEDPRVQPEDGPLAVLYEDADLVVINKPARLAVHPGAGRPTGTLVHVLLHRYPEMVKVGGVGRPGIVHRLDMDTTGVMVVARTEAAYHALVDAFAERRVEKYYQAIGYGHPNEMSGLIDLPIGRHPTERKKMAVIAAGRPSRTAFVCRGQGAGICRFDLDLQTGRTHQIRVHLKAIHHPLVGDPLYGEARWKQWPRKQQKPLAEFSRPALHAWRLGFEHPRDGRRMRFEAPTPDDMRQLWRRVTDSTW